MKSYTITVNGTAYEVTVEETGSVSAPAAAPVAAPKAAPAAAPKAAAPAAGAGSVKVSAAVPTGQSSQNRSICRPGSKSR